MENTQVLRHPHIVRLDDAGYWEGTFFLTLEYCDGGSVDGLMRSRGGPLPVSEAVPIVLQCLDGMDYAHQAELPRVPLADGRFGQGRGLVHRDLKPANLFLCGSGPGRVAKVGDFGLAKAFDLAGLSGQTSTGSGGGTPAFMPRQQVINFKYARPDVDLWALAASLYYMLTGVYPRDFPPGKDPCQHVVESRAMPIRQRDPAIPRRLADVLDHALLDQPTIPFQSAAEFKRALSQAL
jgi:serine/threonine protein kinase